MGELKKKVFAMYQNARLGKSPVCKACQDALRKEYHRKLMSAVPIWHIGNLGSSPNRVGTF